MPRRRPFLLGGLLLAPAFAVIACSAPGEPVGSTSAPIVGGAVSTQAQDAVVLLEDTGDLGGGYECTGTLLAPNLVLTARHCVSPLLTDSAFSCDRDGNVNAGDATLGPDVDPAHLDVRIGVKRPPDAQPVAARGVRLFHDDSKVLCNHDLALVLLDTKIAGATIAPIRLDDTVAPGETFTAVGWGVTEATDNPATRMQRTGIKVEDVGPTTDATLGADVGGNEFLASEGTCEGDSGAPAIAASGAVLGVVSRGGNGTAASTVAQQCVGPTTANFFTELQPFRALILSAYAAAGADPWLEGNAGPAPIPSDPGGGSSGAAKGGCATSPLPAGGNRSSSSLLFALAALGAFVRRRAPR